MKSNGTLTSERDLTSLNRMLRIKKPWNSFLSKYPDCKKVIPDFFSECLKPHVIYAHHKLSYCDELVLDMVFYSCIHVGSSDL